MKFPFEINQLLNKIKQTTEEIKQEQLEQLKLIKQQESFNLKTNQIKKDLDLTNHNLDELEILADECEDESTRSKALELVEEYRKESNQLRTNLRTISLEVKLRISKNLLDSSRDELLKGVTKTTTSLDNNKKDKNPDEALMSASSNVTQSLRNTLEIMRQELDRSVVSTHMLEQQTKTMELTTEQYNTFEDLMKTSKAILSTLQRSNLIDKLLLSISLIFFILVCLFILKKRIFDRGFSFFSTILSPLFFNNKKNSNLVLETTTTTTTTNNDIMFKKQENLQDHYITTTTTTVAAAAIATATAIALLPNDLVISPSPPSQPSQPQDIIIDSSPSSELLGPLSLHEEL